MESNKKKRNVLVALIAIVGVLLCGTVSYAIFKGVATGTAQASVAKWDVKVNGVALDSPETKTITLSGDAVKWEPNANVADGKLAPGSKGTVTFDIDAGTTEVSVGYNVTVGEVTDGTGQKITNAQLSVAGNSGTGEILHGDAERKKTVTINVEWTATDNETANKEDMLLHSKDIKIPVTVAVSQKTA